MKLGSVPSAASRLAFPARRGRRFGRWSVMIALALTVALPGSAFAWSNYSFDSSAEQTMLTKINQYRASYGLAPFVWDSTLGSVARQRSKNMYDYNYLSHTQPDGSTVFTILNSIGYCITNAGEVIAKNNYPDDQTVTVAFNGWMGSSAHRAILMGTWAVIGIGIFKGDGRNGGTDSATYPDHLFTAVVANPCGSSTPKPTPTATPKPTPTPTPKPTSNATPTPKPTVKPTPAPTATAVGSAPPAVSPEPSLSPDPGASLAPSGPVVLDPAEQLGPLSWKDWWVLGDVGGGVPLPTPEPTPEPTARPSGEGLAVVDPLPTQSLLDTIVGGIAGAYFGH